MQIAGAFGMRNSQGRRNRKRTKLHEKYDYPMPGNLGMDIESSTFGLVGMNDTLGPSTG